MDFTKGRKYMLINCPECEAKISDKAVTCPQCGFPIMRATKPKTNTKKRMRLPNGFGRISEIKGRNLRKPFRVRVTVGVNEFGRPIAADLKPESHFATYNEAYAALLKYHENPYDLSPDISLKELYDKWTDEYFKQIKDSAIRTITSSWAYCSTIYNMRAKDVRARHIKGVIENGTITIKTGKQKGEIRHTSPNVKSKIKSMFNLMFDYAVEYEIVDHNYARDFELSNGVTQDIESAKNSHMIFSDEEMNILWENLGKVKYVDIILFQCYTGLRPQEIGLIETSKLNIHDWYFHAGIKTAAGINRLIPIHEKIRPIVQSKYNEALLSGSKYLIVADDTVTHKGGNKLTYDKYRHRFKKVVEALKLSPNHRAHDPRKHFITMAKKAGVDDYVIKLIVGHAITDVTEKVYTERDIEWLHKEIAKI